MIELGTVLLPPTPDPTMPVAAWHVLVELQPDGRTVDARVANVGQGPGKGAFWPLLKGDEVIVLLPGGDPNRAVVLGSLGNAKSPNPTANTGLRPLLMHPAGVELRSADGLPAHGLVLAPLLQDLQAFVTALLTFMGTAGTATGPAAPVAAAAATFLADPAVQTLLAGLTASAAPNNSVPPGVGAPPYATPTHKATT